MVEAKQPLVVVMGVSGVGKSVVGEALGQLLALPYADGDTFHSPAHKAKMAAGHPLTDADRWPWLRTIGSWLAEHGSSGAVVSCSALRRAYRDVLRESVPSLVFCQLRAEPAQIRARIEQRAGHFMPATLLASQLATLEPLAADEPGRVLDVGAHTPSELAAQFASFLSAHALP